MVAPGWYPDPDNPGSRRYYDGTSWSAPIGDGGPAPAADGPAERAEQPAPPAARHAAPAPADRRRRRWPWLVGALAVLVVAAAIAVPLIVVDGGSTPAKSSGHPSIAYGSNAVTVAKQLKVCPKPTQLQNVARCEFPDGATLAVSSIPAAAAQSVAVDLARGSSYCELVGPGFVVAAQNRLALSAHVNIAAIEHEYGAALHGKC